MGSVTKTEQQPSIPKKRQSNRIEIRNVPSHVTQQVLEDLIKNWGTVKKVHQVPSDSEPFYTVIFDTPEEAQSACEHLNDYNLEGNILKVEITNNNPASGKLANNFRGPRNMGHNSAPNLVGPRPVRNGGGCPLRILVPSDYVGAIIGRKGQTIKNITQKCKARVDVHGKENGGMMDKISDKVVISIYGQPENCTNACKEILQVLQQESTTNNRGDVLLKMLANDRFCGRIIGKEGKMIKKIKEETGTKIAVSNAQEMAALFPDRVIAIKGTLEGMSQAESAISAKLAECIEQDQAQSFHGGIMMPHGPLGPNCFYPNGRIYEGPGFYAHPPHPLLHPHLHHPGAFHPHPGPRFNHPIGPGVIQNETLHISVPNTAVGALIGTGGVTIKQMMRDSMAFINIESKKEGDASLERVVIIKGTPDSCWRAAFLVFEKMKMEGFAGHDEVRLKTSIEVPKHLVGRVIGKAGKNVRELQRLTGALIKLPEDPTTQGEQVAVDIFGNFLATRNAVSRIRNMMIQSQLKGAYNNNQQQNCQLPHQNSQEPQQHQEEQEPSGNIASQNDEADEEEEEEQKC